MKHTVVSWPSTTQGP